MFRCSIFKICQAKCPKLNIVKHQSSSAVSPTITNVIQWHTTLVFIQQDRWGRILLGMVGQVSHGHKHGGEKRLRNNSKDRLPAEHLSSSVPDGQSSTPLQICSSVIHTRVSGSMLLLPAQGISSLLQKPSQIKIRVAPYNNIIILSHAKQASLKSLIHLAQHKSTGTADIYKSTGPLTNFINFKIF